MALFKRRKKEDQQSESQQQQSQAGKQSGKKTEKQTEKKEGSGTSMKDLYKKEEGKQDTTPKDGSKKATEKKSTGEKSAAKKKKDSEAAPTEGTKRHGISYRVLVKPIITERSGDLGVYNKYVFEVAVNANKVDISKSIEEVYGVTPTKVNVINKRGKRVRFGRLQGKRKDTKKAIVTLPKGKSINVYEGV